MLWLLAFKLGVSFGQVNLVQAPSPSEQRPSRLYLNNHLNQDRFDPVQARYVRMTIEEATRGEVCLDEFEVFTAGTPSANAALRSAGARVTVSGSIQGFAIHQPEHLNDGLYGNEHSWIAGPESPAWLQIEFPEPIWIDRVVWSRDRTGRLWDRVASKYFIDVALDTNAWQRVASSTNYVHGKNTFVIGAAWTGFDLDTNVQAPGAKVRTGIQPAEDHLITHWHIEDGLPQNSVTSITQSPDGYLWVATFNGLARFDGARFTVLNQFTKPALTNPRLIKVKSDLRGRIWIQDEDRQIHVLEAGSLETVPPPPGELNSWVVDTRGILWMVTSKSVYTWDGSQLNLWTPPDTWAPEDFRHARFCLDVTGTLWIAVNGKGIGRVIGDRFQESAYPRGQKIFLDAVLCRALDGGIWLKDEGGQIRRIQSNGEIGPTTPLKPHGDFWVAQCLEDRLRNLWCATEEQGVWCVLPNGSMVHYTTTNGLPSNRVKDLFEDREGNIWIGTDGGGLSRFKRRIIWAFGPSAGLGDVFAHAASASSDDALWIGTAGRGAFVFAGDTLLEFPGHENARFVWSILKDTAGAVWLGTYGGGVFRFREKFWENHGFFGGGVTVALFQDSRKRIWAGGAEGLALWHEDHFEFFERSTGFNGGFVRSIAEDAQGQIWAATSDRGLYRFDDSDFQNFRVRDGLSTDKLWSLYADRKGGLWIGTFGAGLCYFHGGKFTRIGMAHGLPDGVICGIIEDDSGRLWLSSNKGLCWASVEQLQEFIDGRRKTIFFSQYGRSEGVPTLEFTGGAASTATRTRDGRLWFTSTRGPVVVDPNRLVANTNAPQVFVEEVQIDSLPAPIAIANDASVDEALTIPAGTKRIEFRYTGLSLVAPEKVQFKHRLDGFDLEWVDDGSQRLAKYTGLRPGKYLFRVQAANNDGVWNEAGAKLRLEVLPFFWETAWFKVGAALLVVAAFFAFYWWRVTALERRRMAQEEFSRELIDLQENERKRIARELHDSLGQTLLLIRNRAAQGTGDMDPKTAKQHLTAISELSNAAVQEARQIAHDLRPPQFDNAGFTAALRAMLDSVAATAPFQLEHRIEDLDGLFDGRDEISLYRAVQEALNNVLKHAHAANVNVEARRDILEAEVVVSDDGKGFNPAELVNGQVRSGMGLHGIEERVHLIGGRLEVDSSPGAGTTLRISIPIREA
ncbi:MAG: two-component regulator propeller domain-containing protein [Verrucomicrobiota bacterium]